MCSGVADKQDWRSGQHSSVDSTFIKARADHRIFVCKDACDETGGSVKGETCGNATHESTTDQNARATASEKQAASFASRNTH